MVKDQVLKLNIGCGKEKKDGYIGIDIQDFGQEILRDIDNTYLPFQDNSVDEIFCKHTFEHLSNSKFVLEEFARVLRTGGRAFIIVPHKDNDGAYVFNHKKYFSKESFGKVNQFNINGLLLNGLVEHPAKDIHFSFQKQDTKEKQLIYPEKLQIDIACGRAKDKDAIGIDIDDYGQEIVGDIRKGLPFRSGSVNLIIAHNILEHLDSESLLFVMKECHRVLKKDGKLDIVVPFAGSDGSFRDPTHQCFFTENTFDYFAEGRPKHYDINPKHKFKKIKVEEKNGGAVYAILTPIK